MESNGLVTTIPQDEDEVKRLLNKFLVQEEHDSMEFLKHSFGMSRDKAYDVYQNSSIVLYENIRNGKVMTLKKSLNAYFRQVCRFQAYKALANEPRFVSFDDIPEWQSGKPYDSNKIKGLLEMTPGFSSRQKETMFNLVNHLPEPCKTILIAYHYERKSYGEIVGMLPGVNNVKSAKVRRSQCQTKLKNKFQDKIKEIQDGED